MSHVSMGFPNVYGLVPPGEGARQVLAGRNEKQTRFCCRTPQDRPVSCAMALPVAVACKDPHNSDPLQPESAFEIRALIRDLWPSPHQRDSPVRKKLQGAGA